MAQSVRIKLSPMKLLCPLLALLLFPRLDIDPYKIIPADPHHSIITFGVVGISPRYMRISVLYHLIFTHNDLWLACPDALDLIKPSLDLCRCHAHRPLLTLISPSNPSPRSLRYQLGPLGETITT